MRVNFSITSTFKISNKCSTDLILVLAASLSGDYTMYSLLLSIMVRWDMELQSNTTEGSMT